MTYQFDDFALDVGTRRLLRRDEEIHLSPKALDLLAVLIENRKQAVAKGNLLERLWPATYVTETNLAGLVAELRRALADSADEPRYIRTVPRFGYWFVGHVREDDHDDGPAKRPARYWLVWDTRQIALNDGVNVLGRAADTEVWLDAPGVSRHHARITVAAEIATLEDLGSKNGTFLRGESSPSRPVSRTAIRSGSVR